MKRHKPNLERILPIVKDPTKRKLASFFMDECTRNLVVLRTIFKNLNAADLIQCRLVNKLWLSEIDKINHSQKICLKISCKHMNEQMQQLSSLIPHMNLPFNGLSIRQYGSRKNHSNKHVGDKLHSILKFLEVLPKIRHLDFDDSAADEHVIIQIIELSTESLKTLSFENGGMFLSSELVNAILKLKNLTTIKTNGPDWMRYPNLRLMINKCESLKRVEGVPFMDFDGVAENRVKTIKHFSAVRYSGRVEVKTIEGYLEKVGENQRFHSLNITPLVMLSVPPCVVNLLNSCKQTLTSVTFCQSSWFAFTHFLTYFEPLPFVREVHGFPINFKRVPNLADGIQGFANFFTYCFPKLSFVELQITSEWSAFFKYYEKFTKTTNNLTQTSVSCVKTVKFLTNEESPPTSVSALSLLAYPNATNLDVELSTYKLQSDWDVFGEGPEVQNLTIRSNGGSRDEIESELLGISAEEVVRIKHMYLSENDVRKLQIVPIRPPLHHIAGLKKFKGIFAYTTNRGSIELDYEKRINNGIPSNASEYFRLASFLRR